MWKNFLPKPKDLAEKVRTLDKFIFLVLVVLLFSNFFYTEMNVIYDDFKYYSLTAEFTGTRPIDSGAFEYSKDILPGYSLLATGIFYPVKFVAGFFEETILFQDEYIEWEFERHPPEKLLLKDSFSKLFVTNGRGDYYDWKIGFSLILTSYLLLFIGIIGLTRILQKSNGFFKGYLFIPLTFILSPIFMHNLITTPIYPTIAAFGISAIFTYFFVNSFLEKRINQANTHVLLAGFFLGLLMLIRFEGLVLFLGLTVCLFAYKEKIRIKRFVLGFLISACSLLIYNSVIFGNPFTFGFLKNSANFFGIDMGYIFLNLVHPESGILFWSPLIVIGIIGLFLSKQKYSKYLGISAVLLILTFIVRVSTLVCPNEFVTITTGTTFCVDAITLIRYDINRYISILIPFSIIGLNNILTIITIKIKYKLKLMNKKNKM